ncbi:MAG TPA: hypothetical protein DCR14_06690, partial [Acidimicrobiaceae bacterium]|nr:hypothetical protein [Acidimicrobiaceae bacterium]
MAAFTDLPGLQLSWVEGNAVAWQPGRGMYGTHLPLGAERTPSGAPASPRVVRLHLPSGPTTVLAQRLSAATLTSLGELDVLHSEASPSVAWFGAVYTHAEVLVRRRRVLPVLQRLGPTTWQATWAPLASDVEAAQAGLLAAMPPVVAAGGRTDPADILRAVVDQLTRTTLAAAGWHTFLTDTRALNARAVRLLTRALSSGTSQFVAPVELADSLTHLAREFELMERRAAGEPILRARLRLGVPRGPELTFDDLDS